MTYVGEVTDEYAWDFITYEAYNKFSKQILIPQS